MTGRGEVRAPVHLRENKAIPVEPIWVLGVEVHEFVKEDMSYRGHAHGSARMAGVGFRGGIDLGGHQWLTVQS